jgi:hypothetical protein
MGITYIIGDVIKESIACNHTTVIPHICNNKGAWGAGFVLALSKVWKRPENSYKRWYKSDTNFALGMCQAVKVEKDISVINMVAQDGFPSKEKPVAVDYQALETCLAKVNNWVNDRKKENKKGYIDIAMPRIGCGIGGGTWEVVESIINKTLTNQMVYVYSLK